MTNDFPLASPGSRPPVDVFLLKRIAEIRREVDGRKRFYPQQVAQGRMTEMEMEHELRIFAAIADDLEAALRLEQTGVWALPGAGDGPPEPEALHQAWEAKVRALRRELAMRRNFYPRRIAQCRLSADEAAKQIERLEAVHWMYWVDAFCMVACFPAGSAERRTSDALLRAHDACLRTGPGALGIFGVGDATSFETAAASSGACPEHSREAIAAE